LGEPISREWNQISLDSIFYYGNLITTLRIWYPDAGDNNKDITDYLGYGHLKLDYMLGKHQFNLTWRNNLHFDGDNRGSIEAEWSYPIGQSKNNFWYFKAFNGYGASLMDYNHQQNRVGFGFSFSR
ncbi:MAG: phospholipase A, partial [Sulfuricurvum sp.]|nr:phospholipase A [Sulfuricurvum sp.]